MTSLTCAITRNGYSGRRLKAPMSTGFFIFNNDLYQCFDKNNLFYGDNPPRRASVSAGFSAMAAGKRSISSTVLYRLWNLQK
jgi:hypothetical protein